MHEPWRLGESGNPKGRPRVYRQRARVTITLEQETLSRWRKAAQDAKLPLSAWLVRVAESE